MEPEHIHDEEGVNLEELDDNIEDSYEDSDDNIDSSNDDDDASEEDVMEQENINKWGMKRVCPLNVLASFHSVTGFPPDLMHDLLEGVVAEDLLSIIRGLSRLGWFSIEAYNSSLRSHGWLLYEVTDKPQPVPLKSSVAKLKGKACSQWVHCRNFPLLIKKFVLNKDEQILALGLKLHELTERITANEFREYEIQLLEECVIDYLDMRKQIRDNIPDLFKRPKPKHHFIRLTVKQLFLRSCVEPSCTTLSGIIYKNMHT